MASWLIVLITALVAGTIANVVLEMFPNPEAEATLRKRLAALERSEIAGPYVFFASAGLLVALLSSVMAGWAVILVTTLLVGTAFLVGPELARERSIGSVTATFRDDGLLFTIFIYLLVGYVAFGYDSLLHWLA